MKLNKITLVALFTFLSIGCTPSETPTVEEPTSDPTISSPTTIDPTTDPTTEETTTTIEPTISESLTEESTTAPSISNPTTEEGIKIEECYIVTESVNFVDIDDIVDPYLNINEDEFYQDYKISDSYADAYYRTLHGLLSGENIEEDGSYKQHNDAPMYDETTYLKNAYARFGINKEGERISYTINTLDGSDYTIYKGGIYVSMNDVAAYLFAFNELPVNHLAGANLKNEAVERYGEFGRVNFNKYTGPSATKYQYEPYLKGQDDKTLFYREIDFGANIGSDHYFSYKSKYNSSNGRGPFRLLLANSYDSSYTYNKKSEEYSTPNPTEIDDRYVYYTYNHYNDFLEYLNYYDGFAAPFGNCTAGIAQNQYVASNPPTERVDSILATF